MQAVLHHLPALRLSAHAITRACQDYEQHAWSFNPAAAWATARWSCGWRAWHTSTMDNLHPSPTALRDFRTRFYACLDRRADALFELTDAALIAGPQPSLAHLSLAGPHRRG